jgi:predicted ATPase
MLGFADQARKLADQALDNAPPGAIEGTMTNSAAVFYFLRDLPRLRQISDRLLAIADQHGFPRFSAMARLDLSVCLAHSGDFARAIPQAKQAIEDYRATGAPVGARVLHELIDILLIARRADEGLNVVAEASESSLTKEGAGAIDLPRLRGELLLIRNPPDRDGAEVSFRRSIELARIRECRLRELQATIGLARLLRDTNRRGEARAMLADIYNWFTEGFDTADLKDAKALLDELSA